MLDSIQTNTDDDKIKWKWSQSNVFTILQAFQTWRCPIPVRKNYLEIAFIGEKKKQNFQLVSLRRQNPHWREFDKRKVECPSELSSVRC